MKNILRLTTGTHTIERELFHNKNIDEVLYNEELIKIDSSSFAYNNITEFTMPLNLVYVLDSAFYNNKISKVIFNEKITKINRNTFENNRIKKLHIPENITEIEEKAFRSNMIEEIIIENENIKIAHNAFSNNDTLKKVTIKINNEYIKLNKDDLNKLKELDKNRMYGRKELDHISDRNNYLVNYAKFKYHFKNNGKELLKIPIEAITMLNGNRVNANMMRLKVTKYNNFLNRTLKYKRLRGERPYYNEYIFPFLYMLDFFRDGDEKELFNIITKVSNTYLGNLSEYIKLNNNFNDKKTKLLLEIFNDENYRHYDNLISAVYNNYSNIDKFIKTNYNEIIHANLNNKINKISNKENKTKKDLEELKKIKEEIISKNESINKMKIKDIFYYLKNKEFVVKPHNENLKEIIPHLKGLTQTEFDELERIYEQSKGINKNFIFTEDNNEHTYKYKWLKGNDPYNLALGYIVNNCAKLKGAGEDIMIQSMINENVANLVVIDKKENIIAKSTAYLNNDYIYFNSADSKEWAIKEEVRNAIRRATIDQVKALEEKGIIINNVKIGLKLNNVFDEHSIEATFFDLLDNYKYENYLSYESNSQGTLYERKLNNDLTL